jgi:hypothetical protein
MNHERPAVLYERDVRRELRCGRHLARRLIHEVGVRLGERRIGIPRERWESYLLLRNMRPTPGGVAAAILAVEPPEPAARLSREVDPTSAEALRASGASRTLAAEANTEPEPHDESAE